MFLQSILGSLFVGVSILSNEIFAGPLFSDLVREAKSKGQDVKLDERQADGTAAFRFLNSNTSGRRFLFLDEVFYV